MVSMGIGGSGGVLDTAAGIGVGIADAAGARIPAMLRCLDPLSLGVVLFDYNPKDITFSRQNTIRNPSGMGKATTPQTINPGPVNIKLADVYFEGITTKLRCDNLLTWMEPSKGLIGMLISAAIGKGLTIQPPNLTFQWGPPMFGFMYTVQMKSCSILYERFDSTGIPIRAKVSLAFQEVPSIVSTIPTNPTSGGQPGRHSHVVADGQSLASLANDYYGKPGLWRRIAEVNGIDDPSRVRPGTTVYLPNATELTDGST